MQIQRFQDHIARIYGRRDNERGVSATVAWIVEEVGELAQAVRKGSPADQAHELGDVMAWLASLANQLGISLDSAISRFDRGCPRCRSNPCECP